MTPNFATWPGTLLDATAKAAHKARLGELRADLEEARSGNDPVRASGARAELDFLAAELARAVGLGGRDRRGRAARLRRVAGAARVLSDLVAGAPAGEDTDTDGR
jgi:hypothetical protein